MSVIASVLIAIIRCVVFIYDIITFPIYFFIQKPWELYNLKKEPWATEVSSFASSSESEVTYRSTGKKYFAKNKICKELEENGVDTIEKMFSFICKKYKDKPCVGTRKIHKVEERKHPDTGKVIKYYKMGDYHWQSYDQMYDRVLKFGKGIRELGYEEGTKVVIYADTRADWLVAAHGCFKFNYTLCTIYTNLGIDGVKHAISQTGSQIAIVSQELLTKLAQLLPILSSIKTIIVLEEPWNGEWNLEAENIKIYTFDTILKLGGSSELKPNPPTPSDTAVIMYTSGSTGVPKGVVQTHWNIINAMISLAAFFGHFPQEFEGPHYFIAYLPLAHILEFCAENVSLMFGMAVGYSNPNTLIDSSAFIKPGDKGDAAVLKPTVMACVPLVVDRIYKGIKAKVEKQSAFKAKLFNFGVDYRLKWNQRGMDTPIVNKFIFSSATGIVGGRLKALVAGGAPLAPKSHEFVRTVLGVNLSLGYGLTETIATATVGDPHDTRTGLVGPPLVGVDLKLVSWPEGGYTVHDACGPRGEVVIGGNHVAKGYFNMPEKTAEDFFDGPEGYRWLRTGDIGHIMPDGNLKIIDRKKDLVKLQMGEYVSLGKVESVLKVSPLVDSICVVAHPDQTYAIAIVVPEPNNFKNLSQELGKTDFLITELCQDGLMKQIICDRLNEFGISSGLEKFEIPKKITLVSDEWTPDSGLVTAAMKLKRKAIEQYYAREIEHMYEKYKNTSNGTTIHRQSKVSPA